MQLPAARPECGLGQIRACALLLLAAVLVGFATGCASPRPIVPQARSFVFGQDTLAYDNELLWDYTFNDDGDWSARKHEPEPEYTRHCFVVVRTAKQFFLNARFDPTQPAPDQAACRKLVRRVVDSDPRNAAPEALRIVIPGYTNLHDFSAAWAPLLQAECGSFWQSYFQRGHWRMIFPFSRSHQEEAVRQLLDSVRANRPAIVHIACFPSLRVNHALLLYDARETEGYIVFSVYDPNDASQSSQLTFDRVRRTFSYPTNRYFSGGDVNVYEVYVNRWY